MTPYVDFRLLSGRYTIRLTTKFANFEGVIEFDPCSHANLFLSGYTHVLFINMHQYGLLYPLKSKVSDDVVIKLRAIQLRMMDEAVIEMANGTTCYEFYIQEDF